MKQYGKSWYETFMGDLHTSGVAVTRVSPNEMYKQPVKEEAMKVQHRSKDIIGIEWEAVDEAKAYYIVKDPAGFLQVLDKKDYEPVQEWVSIYTFEMCGMKGKEVRAVHSGNGFITIEVKR